MACGARAECLNNFFFPLFVGGGGGGSSASWVDGTIIRGCNYRVPAAAGACVVAWCEVPADTPVVFVVLSLDRTSESGARALGVPGLRLNSAFA